jgi:autotransporter translocation and assembly factor TamB
MAAVLLLPVVLAAVGLSVVLTGPGLRMLEGIIDKASGGMVGVTGLDIALPGGIGASRVEVTDTRGVWLTVEG